jgi:hypothetical protein
MTSHPAILGEEKVTDVCAFNGKLGWKSLSDGTVR